LVDKTARFERTPISIYYYFFPSSTKINETKRRQENIILFLGRIKHSNLPSSSNNDNSNSSSSNLPVVTITSTRSIGLASSLIILIIIIIFMNKQTKLDY